MTERSDNLDKIKALNNPALQAVRVAGFIRARLDGLRESGVKVTAMVYTFEEAGLASAGEGVLVTDARLDLEFRCTIGPDFTVDVYVQPTTEKHEHLARMLNAFAPLLVRLAGLKPIPKGD